MYLYIFVLLNIYNISNKPFNRGQNLYPTESETLYVSTMQCPRVHAQCKICSPWPKACKYSSYIKSRGELHQGRRFFFFYHMWMFTADGDSRKENGINNVLKSPRWWISDSPNTPPTAVRWRAISERGSVWRPSS